MAVSEMEQIGYEQGMQDMHDYVIKTIRNAIENPALDIIPAKMALQVLLASLNTEESQLSPLGGRQSFCNLTVIKNLLRRS